MAKSARDRIDDTLGFLETNNIIDGVQPENYRGRLAIILREKDRLGLIPNATGNNMSIGSSGTATTRQYRRAMILILSVFGNSSAQRVRAAVDNIPDTQLRPRLGSMVQEAIQNVGRREVQPKMRELVTTPATFLANDRIQISRGSVTVSRACQYLMSHKILTHRYIVSPVGGMTIYEAQTTFPGFNIHVQKFNELADISNIAGVEVEGNAAFTTELSNCSILYKVTAETLVAAHVMPVGISANLPPGWLAPAYNSSGALQSFLLTDRGGLANQVEGALFGVYGKVKSDAEIGRNDLNGVRFHGYYDDGALGRAYFLGMKLGDGWNLFCQQNDRARDTVSHWERIYPTPDD